MMARLDSAAVRNRPALATVAQLADFDEIIDVRSEGEYADDHIPGAINCPVLDNAERARVGTIYKQQSPFEAKKVGAALVSANIARHINGHFLGRAREWRPLVYCWRGGNRSGAFAHVLSEVGWPVARLDGGYQAYRRAVVADLEGLPRAYPWRVICGLTGTGKSRLLGALRAAGAQVLDLESLASHRGSVLGGLPATPQPTQKMFDSLLWNALRRLDATRPVYVEAESRRIGQLRLPAALVEAMWASECLVLEAPVPFRVELLMQEYTHFFDQPETLLARLECLAPLHGRAVIAKWRERVLARDWRALVADLLVTHYDPAYTRAIAKHYPELHRARKLMAGGSSEADYTLLARHCLAEQ